MADFDPVDLAYAAGIMDGEGTIGITEVKADGKRRKSPTIRAYIAVVMTDPVIPAWFAQMFGGTINTYPPRRQGHKPATHWRISGGRAEDVCRAILPYLKLKQEQAKLVIEFRGRTKTWTTKTLPVAELAARREYVSQIRDLNRRGA